MTTEKTYFEYTHVTYCPYSEDEQRQADTLLDDPAMEFRSRKPQGQNMVLVLRRQIEEPKEIKPHAR